MARARQVVEHALALVTLVGLTGCDIVQGFQNAGDALFPPVKTYLDVPGFRLVEGSYAELEMLTTSEPFVLARSATLSDSSLYAFRFNTPKPCRIPDVGGYWSDAAPNADRTYIAYFDGTGSSTLHFSDMDCRPYALTLEDADFPAGVTRTGLVVKAGSELLAVNPETGSTVVLASAVRSVDAQRHLVLAEGKLGAFDRNWTLIRWVGSGVTRFFSAFGAIYLEDEDGIHRLRISTGPTPSAVMTSVAEGACNAAALPAAPGLQLLAFHQPCDEKRLVVWDARTQDSFPLELPADPRYLKLVASPLAAGVIAGRPNLAHDAFWALYLTDLEPSSGTGSLVVVTPDGAELRLGDGAALERTELRKRVPGGEYSGGFALLDAAEGSGRFVSFEADGTVSDIASGVIRDSESSSWTRLVLEVDETRTDLAEVVDGALVRVARNVPRQRYAYTASNPVDAFAGKMAWFTDLEGEEGTLSIAGPDASTGVVDDQGLEPLYTAAVVARGVWVNRHAFLQGLPGLLYFTHRSATTRTGRLEYSNAELGFSALVSDGVADYVQPGSGLLYSVPFGEGAGIWLARAK